MKRLQCDRCDKIQDVATYTDGGHIDKFFHRTKLDGTDADLCKTCYNLYIKILQKFWDREYLGQGS